MYYLFLFLIQACYSDYLHVSKSNIFSIARKNNSYFGYSVQLQQSEVGRIFVGAPKAISTRYNFYQNGVVYSCLINSGKCEEIILEQNRNRTDTIFGLGSSLSADESENGFLVACAPRWYNNRSNQSTTGMCFSLINEKINKLYPLDEMPLYDRKSYFSIYGQVGFSAYLVKDKISLVTSLILGAPGVHNWTGTLTKYSNLDKNESSQIVETERADSKLQQYSYFGYSINAGKFNSSNTNQILYVSGAPRNKDLYGSVNVFDLLSNKKEPFRDRYMFRGTQFSEYFGSSICVGNIDDDELDDIIIGAPNHSIDTLYDVGCIYVFRAEKHLTKITFKKHFKITGEEGKSRFGFAISYLGDINKDGFGDIAVSAPYFDNNRGVIYLYFGSDKGLKSNYKQKILASQIDENLRGFGYSLSKGVDVDRNTNNDLAVGAYLSGHVVLLISQPIVKIKINMSLESGSHLTNRNIKYCINYAAESVLPEFYIELKFSILNSSAITFQNKNNNWTKEIAVKGYMESCETFIIDMQGKKFDDTNLKMDYSIINISLEEKFKPMEEHHAPFFLQIPSNKGCVSNVCKPDIELTAYFKNNPKHWIIGSVENIDFDIILYNAGELASRNELFLEIFPEHMKLTLLPNYCNQRQNNIVCNIKSIAEQTNKSLSFAVDVTKLKLNDERVILNITIVSANDINLSDNNKILEIPLKTNINFTILSKSQPSETNNLTGIQIINHQFNIDNIGTTLINELKLFLLIPYEYKKTNIIHDLIISGCTSQNILTNNFIPTDNKNNDFVVNFHSDNILFINCTKLKDENVKCRRIECDIVNTKTFANAMINITLMINSRLSGNLQHEGPIIISTTFEPDFKYITSYSNTWSIFLNKKIAASISKWVIIGTVVAILLVLILIFVLCKCNFFKKKKFPDEHVALIIKSDTEEE